MVLLRALPACLQVMLLLHELFSKYDDLADAHDVYKVETIGDVSGGSGGAGQGAGGRDDGQAGRQQEGGGRRRPWGT